MRKPPTRLRKIAVPIVIDNVAGLTQRLLQLKTAIDLAIGTLGKVDRHGEVIVLSGATDILTAAARLAGSPCTFSLSGINTTVVDAGANHDHPHGSAAVRSACC